MAGHDDDDDDEVDGILYDGNAPKRLCNLRRQLLMYLHFYAPMSGDRYWSD